MSSMEAVANAGKCTPMIKNNPIKSRLIIDLIIDSVQCLLEHLYLRY